MICPKCNSDNVKVDTFQEQTGSITITKTKSKYKEKGHGILWWLCIGCWWWIVDFCLWIYFFIPRLIARLFSAPYKKKKYSGKSTSVSKTSNQIQYKTICVCQNCGYRWDSEPQKIQTDLEQSDNTSKEIKKGNNKIPVVRQPWYIIVAVFFFAGGLGNISQNTGAAIFGCSIGLVMGLFTFWNIKDEKETDIDEQEDSE